jgi:hypothetical protein
MSPISQDVKRQDGSDGPLSGKRLEQIYRTHHNLDQRSGDLLPGFTTHQGKGCECDHCQEYLQK